MTLSTRRSCPSRYRWLVDLLGKQVTLGIIKEIRNKQVKNTTTGEYEDSPESREENVTDKVFHYPSNLTVVEAKKGTQTPTFHGAWVEKNAGQVRDRRSSNDNTAGRSGRPPGAPPTAAQSAAKTTSLFG